MRRGSSARRTRAGSCAPGARAQGTADEGGGGTDGRNGRRHGRSPHLPGRHAALRHDRDRAVPGALRRSLRPLRRGTARQAHPGQPRARRPPAGGLRRPVQGLLQHELERGRRLLRRVQGVRGLPQRLRRALHPEHASGGSLGPERDRAQGAARAARGGRALDAPLRDRRPGGGGGGAPRRARGAPPPRACGDPGGRAAGVRHRVRPARAALRLPGPAARLRAALAPRERDDEPARALPGGRRAVGRQAPHPAALAERGQEPAGAVTAARDRTGVPEGACVLVTGAAGFLGFHVARALLARGERVLGVDRSGGPEPALAAARLARLQAHDGFAFRRADIAEAGALEAAASGTEIGRAVHLAGHAGRRGADVPTLVRDNVRATAQVLAFCRARGIARLVHASSAAVYGGPGPAPAPVSAYGATKRRAEILARAAARAGGPQAVSLRYFTLYGPWSARASAARTFADAILDGRPVRLHGHGRMRRSFTFVEDAAAATLAALDGLPQPDANGTPWAAADVRHPAATGLEAFVDALEAALDGLPQPDANGTPWAA
ncbi:MAG: NAD-dependent epimerase/dehydratase family protein, partial [Boseongicola sp. SB0662_bin_57]|nr:NAD-dependent epimerase/dehydratase family protein [Boseongicola sp. SB0662_bin_57]